MYHAGQDSQVELTVKTNWKLSVETYCESYHLPLVHPSLSSYSPLEDHYSIEHSQFCSGQGRRVYQQMRDQHDRCFPNFEGLSDKWQTAAEYIAVCPKCFAGGAPRSYVCDNYPARGPEKQGTYTSLLCHLKARHRITAPQPGAVEKVFEEDTFVVEGMQRGRHAPDFDGGRF